MPSLAKVWKLKPRLSENQEPISSEICLHTSFQLLLYIMKVKSQEDHQFCSLNFSHVKTGNSGPLPFGLISAVVSHMSFIWINSIFSFFLRDGF